MPVPNTSPATANIFLPNFKYMIPAIKAPATAGKSHKQPVPSMFLSREIRMHCLCYHGLTSQQTAHLLYAAPETLAALRYVDQIGRYCTYCKQC